MTKFSEFTQHLKGQSRLLIEAELVPLQGSRFQPTGFPDLGAATYLLPDENKTEMLLVESSQSVANRLEQTIWDEAKQDIIPDLQGISYVVVKEKQTEKILTNSLLEAHRLNSYYILEGEDKTFFNLLKQELDIPDEGAIDINKFARVLAKYDINCLLHGIFLAKKDIGGGRFRLARSLSGFIEAKNVNRVVSGGVKNDQINPKADAKKGGGNIPYSRDEYVAENITAYFSLDLAQIRGYRLDTVVEDLLIAIAIYKIQAFLNSGLRLRTACDFECVGVKISRPKQNIELPELTEIKQVLPQLVKAASHVFATPAVTVVSYQSGAKDESKKDKATK